MRLEKFRVANFRNIADSGWIDVAGTTALVGRNESGKTNLLHALRSLSGPDVDCPLSLTRDFPADRLRSEYSEDLPVVETRWQLSEDEHRELAEILPHGNQVSAVEVSRGYAPERRVNFCGLEETQDPLDRAKELVARLAALSELEESMDSGWSQAMDDLRAMVARGDAPGWDAEIGRVVHTLEEASQACGAWEQTEVREAIEAISELGNQPTDLSGYEEAGRQWVLSRLPAFLYLDEYPDIDGHMDLPEFDRRRREGLTELGDRHFETLLRMAGIDPDSLEEILNGDPETRRQLVGRAGAGLTRKLRELWTDRPLKVRFNLDGDHFNTLVCDPTAVCDIEVNLNQRSRGFRWFFSFFVMLTAGRRDPGSADAVLLLDEPGIHLHAAAQQDLLRHLSEHIENQSLIATQSPFMLPRGARAAVRAVRFDEESGSTVGDDPSPEELGAASLSPPMLPEAADGVSAPAEPAAGTPATEALVGALFGSEPVLVVENLTDFWYLSAVADQLARQQKPGLPEGLVLMPAGGATLLPVLMSLLGQPSQNPILALTSRPLPHSEAGAEPSVFIGSGQAAAPDQAVELEDLVDPDIYDRFVRAAYREELEGRELAPDLSTAGAVERYREAFDRIGLTFSRRLPARLITGGSERNLRAFLSRQTDERFSRLFQEIRQQLEVLRA
jgi:energy-coupling factor transporter ATP-binding protein EcfA2